MSNDSPKQPDYEAIRDSVLKNWRVAKRAESRERLQQVLDAFIAELLDSTPSSTLPSALLSTEASTPSSAPDGSAAPLVDEASQKFKEGSRQDNYYSNLKQIASRCGYRLSVTPLDTGRNVFHLHQKGSSKASVSTQDINEVLDWLRRQDLLGE